MKKWIQGYQAHGKEKKATEGAKSLYLLTGGESGVSQLSYFWDGGDTVKIEDSAMGMVFEQETVKFPSAEEAKAYVVAKMQSLRGFYDRYCLQVDIPKQWKIAHKKTPDAAATAQGAEK